VSAERDRGAEPPSGSIEAVQRGCPEAESFYPFAYKRVAEIKLSNCSPKQTVSRSRDQSLLVVNGGVWEEAAAWFARVWIRHWYSAQHVAPIKRIGIFVHFLECLVCSVADEYFPLDEI